MGPDTMEVIVGTNHLYEDREKLKEHPEHQTPLENTVNHVSAGTHALGIAGVGVKVAGKVLGLAEWEAVGAAGVAAAGVGAAALGGYKLGQNLDHSYHLSDKASNAMVGNTEDRDWKNNHQVPQHVRGADGADQAQHDAQIRAAHDAMQILEKSKVHAATMETYGHFMH